jgi:hypothetical protein
MTQGSLRKGKITSWLLPVVLVLSLFTFSGVNSSPSIAPFKASTEQIDLCQVTRKKHASFKVFRSAELIPSLDRQSQSNNQFVLAHSFLICTRLKRNEAACETFSVLDRLLHRSVQHSDEDFFISQHG